MSSSTLSSASAEAAELMSGGTAVVLVVLFVRLLRRLGIRKPRIERLKHEIME